ncbi:MAG: hypothetical protein HFH86_04140 [Bacilli bacterium]|jgi:uncharacterized protein (TIGR00730 family)|nr:hypothetical protein [Bacilli bacterium]
MKVFVGCSSRNEIANDYLELAEKVGLYLKDHSLVIGGTFCGMMEKVALANSQKVQQIILKDYITEEMNFENSPILCDSTFLRMNEIWKHADVFLFLPGGVGTLAEILMFLEENRMQKKKKKIILYNYHNYYNKVLLFFENVKEKKFGNSEIWDTVFIVNSMKELQEQI